VGKPPSLSHLPASVRVATLALVLVLVVEAALALLYARRGQAGWAMYAAFLLLFLLLLGGLVRRSRLAWLWARYLSILLGLVVAASLASAIAVHSITLPALAAGVLGLVLPLVAAGVALGRPGAYPFYDLVCPACGTRTSLGEDLLFRRALCRKCHTAW
jgi:hypothetical protein